MKRRPSLPAIIWGSAFIVIAALSGLRQFGVLTTMTFWGVLAPLGLIVVKTLNLILSNNGDKNH